MRQISHVCKFCFHVICKRAYVVNFCTLQTQLAVRNAADKPPTESASTTKSKNKRKMSESKECKAEAPVTKKEQVKPKPAKDKGN